MSSPLPDEPRSRMHVQLAALERAGVPPGRALAMLELPAPWAAAARRAAAALQGGKPLPQALADAALVTPLEFAVLRAATVGGSPALAHERLGAAAAAAAARWKQMRARLLMPAFVLALALFVQPLPGLIAGYIGGGEYLLRTVGTLVLLAALVAGLGHLRQRLDLDGPARAPLEALLLQLPLIGPLLLRGARQRWLENLALLLEAGLPAADAAAAAAGTVRLYLLRERCERLVPMLHGGASLATAVRSVDGLLDASAIGMIATGEGSGRLPELLARHAAAEGREVAASQQQLATWLPRIAYLLVAAWMAQGLIGGAGILAGRRGL